MDYATMTPTNYGKDLGGKEMTYTQDLEMEQALGDEITSIILQSLTRSKYGGGYEIGNVERLLGALLMFRPAATRARIKELEREGE